MSEQFDKSLRNHIRDTFDHYDDQMADDGWKKFNARNNRRKRAIIFWYTIPAGIAAGLAFLFLWNSDMKLPTESKNQITKNKVEVEREDRLREVNLQPLNSVKSDETVLGRDLVKHKFAKPASKTILFKTQESNYTSSQTSIYNHDSAKVNFFIDVKEKSFASIPQTYNHTEESIQIGLTDETKLSATPPIVDLDALVKISKKDNYASNNNKLNKESKFKVGLDASTFMNFSEKGVNENFNLGIGISSEYRLSKKISLHSGLLINQQSSTFDGVDSSPKDRLALNSFTNMVSVPQSQITDAKFVGLDIPLNIKYHLKVGKSAAFISSGLSAYTVINERYVNDFSVINYAITGTKTTNLTVIESNPIGSFSNFSLAQSLNLSFGINYPIAKKTSLSIEPYLKYPLSGLGYQNLVIGAGGISFKLNIAK